MSDTVVWRAALRRCGLSDESITFLASSGGIDGVAALEAVAISSVPEMIRSIRRDAEKAVVLQGGNRPSFNYLHGTKLLAFRVWLEYRAERGQTHDGACASQFLDDPIARFTGRINELKDLKASDEATANTEPPKLKSFEDWETWQELLETHLSHVRNSTLGTPFTYLIRAPMEVELTDMTAAEKTAAYAMYSALTVDEDLVQTSRHSGTSYKRDNNNFFDLLKKLAIEGDCWSFLERFKKTRDGRSAFLLLKSQAEGDYANNAKKQKAYSSITKAHFTGKSAKFSLGQYTAIHQAAHNKLEFCNEVVPETKKVTDFLQGISTSDLSQSILAVYANPALIGDFEQCQQFINTTWGHIQQSHKNTRSIGGVTQNDSAKLQAKRRPYHAPRQPKHGTPKGKGKFERHRSNDDWKSLSKEEQDKIINLRKTKKGAARTAAALKSAEPGLDKTALIQAAADKFVSQLTVAISSVSSAGEETDTAVSGLTLPTPTKEPSIEIEGADANMEETPTSLKRKLPPEEIHKAREQSAGGQFGRNQVGKKLSFPKKATIPKGTPPNLQKKISAAMATSKERTVTIKSVHTGVMAPYQAPVTNTEGSIETESSAKKSVNWNLTLDDNDATESDEESEASVDEATRGSTTLGVCKPMTRARSKGKVAPANANVTFRVTTIPDRTFATKAEALAAIAERKANKKKLAVKTVKDKFSPRKAMQLPTINKRSPQGSNAAAAAEAFAHFELVADAAAFGQPIPKKAKKGKPTGESGGI